MHSSRMRTAHLLTISGGLRSEGKGGLPIEGGQSLVEGLPIKQVLPIEGGLGGRIPCEQNDRQK